VLTAWSQANIVIDREGHARLTEYGLAPVNSEPKFATAGTPGAHGTSRWLAPECIGGPRKGAGTFVIESKPADVFAFAMVAVEVFTDKIPFEGHNNEAAMLQISQGNRPKIPGNAQEVGLTGEMWKLLEICWRQSPKERPAMEEVVMRWEKFVQRNNDDNITTGCAQVDQVIRTSVLNFP
jgi:serine/threonine protein kinase